MSVFSEKIYGRLPILDTDWEAHILEIHARDPSLTPNAFADFKAADGANSYQILADVLPSTPRTRAVLDLACGDGHLIPYLVPRLGPTSKIVGVDMSETAIRLAEAQVRDPRASFQVARAQTLPFAAGEFDFIFCHMAIMLMAPLEPVISEIRRTLKPGGRFSAVIGAGESTGLYREIQRLAALFVQAHLPRYAEARRQGAFDLNALFDSSQFAPEIHEFHLRYHVPPDGIWEYIKSMYFTSLLPADAKRELNDDLMAAAREHLDPSGRVLFHVPMRRLTARKVD